MTDLSDSRIVVTGGGGPGLGQALCHRMAGLGAAIAVLDVDEAAATRVAADVAARWGTQAHAFCVDVADPSRVLGVIEQAVAALGGVDVLINSAGSPLGWYGPFAEQDPASVTRVVTMNLLGPMYVTHAVLPYMYEARRGRIINISSESGKMGMPNLVSYATAKAGILGFTRNLAWEVADKGLTVVAVCPGMMLGPSGFERLADLDDRPSHAVLTDTMARVSIRRAGLPEEVANVVAFLATKAGSYVHGTAVSVGGGISD